MLKIRNWKHSLHLWLKAILSLLFLSLFKSNMSVERRLAHKFSLTCHNRFIAGCCRSGGQWAGTCTLQKVHTLLGLNRLPRPDFLIPWALLWLQIFGQAQPLPAASGQVGGRGLGWPDLITPPTLPRYREVARRVAKKEGWRDRTKLASVARDLVWAFIKRMSRKVVRYLFLSTLLASASLRMYASRVLRGCWSLITGVKADQALEHNKDDNTNKTNRS